MNILSAFIVFDILIVIYELLIEMFSALYELCGLTKEQARFQVTSLLTGTGFTTAESEKMLETTKRKRVTRDIMIVSYIFNISIISTLITLLTSTPNINSTELIIGLALSLIVLILLFFSRRINRIRKLIDKLMLHIAEKMYYKGQNQIIIYDYYENFAMAEVKLNKIPQIFKNKSLSTTELISKYNLKILLIKRKNKIITENIEQQKIYIKDTILLLGKKKTIDIIFKK